MRKNLGRRAFRLRQENGRRRIFRDFEALGNGWEVWFLYTSPRTRRKSVFCGFVTVNIQSRKKVGVAFLNGLYSENEFISYENILAVRKMKRLRSGELRGRFKRNPSAKILVTKASMKIGA